MPVKIAEREFYTSKEAANILQVHTLTILRYIKHGKLKAKKTGKRYFIPSENLLKLLTPEPNSTQ